MNTTLHQLSAAEITANELDEMGKDLCRKAAALRAAYCVHVETGATIEFVFAKKNKTKPKPKTRRKSS